MDLNVPVIYGDFVQAPRTPIPSNDLIETGKYFEYDASIFPASNDLLNESSNIALSSPYNACNGIIFTSDALVNNYSALDSTLSSPSTSNAPPNNHAEQIDITHSVPYDARNDTIFTSNVLDNNLVEQKNILYCSNASDNTSSTPNVCHSNHLTNTHETVLASVACINGEGILDLSVSGRSTHFNNTPAGNSTPLSAASSSSGRSVSEILNSIIRFKDKSTDPDSKKGKNVRKKLQLPSVMSSSNWIALKKASEDEKNAVEEKKEERKREREIKNKALQGKKIETRNRKECQKALKLKKKVIGLYLLI